MEQIFLKKDLNIQYKFPFSVNNINFDELIKFYADGNLNCCFLEGQVGSYKTQMINDSFEYLDENVLVFKFKFFEGTTLENYIDRNGGRFKNIFAAGKNFFY